MTRPAADQESIPADRHPVAVDCTPVVVAGGRSRRFGEADKLLAEVGGRSLVDHAVAASLEATGARPIIATRDRDHARRIDDAVDAVPPRYVHDDPEYAGPVAGVAAALAAVETPWVFVCGGDMPWLSPAAIEALSERADRLDPAGVVPRHEGFLEPLHGFYRVVDLETAVADACGHTSLRGVVERLTPLVTVPTTHADAALRESLADVDEREDLPQREREVAAQ